jgi:hypothetical protein
MTDLSYMYSSIEFVDAKNQFFPNETTASNPKLGQQQQQQLSTMLNSQLKSQSLSSTPASSVSSSSSCSPNSYSNQIELAEQTIMTNKKHDCFQPHQSYKFIMSKQHHYNQQQQQQYSQQKRPIMANLREVLQATHQLRANTKNLDTQKRELLNKLESSMKKRLDISSPSSTSSFGNLESLVELLNLNENSKSNANLKNNTYRYQQNTRSGNSAVELAEKSRHNHHNHNPQQRLRSFRSSSPNNNKLATSSTTAEATKPMNSSSSSGGRMLNSNKFENLKRNFNQRRNSIDLIPFEESHDLNVTSSECAKLKNQSKSSVVAMVKQSISFNNYEKILCEKFNECSSSNQENVVAPPLESLSTDSSSNNWNYDELNELRMKFISLLSDSSKDDDEETNKQTNSASHLKENKEVLLETNKPNSNVDMSKSKSNLFSMVSFKFLGFLIIFKID